MVKQSTVTLRPMKAKKYNQKSAHIFTCYLEVVVSMPCLISMSFR